MKNVNAEVWTYEEDKCIREALETCGTSWLAVRNLYLPHRSVASIRNRYQRLNHRGNPGRNLCTRCGCIKKGHSCPRTMGGTVTRHASGNRALDTSHGLDELNELDGLNRTDSDSTDVDTYEEWNLTSLPTDVSSFAPSTSLTEVNDFRREWLEELGFAEADVSRTPPEPTWIFETAPPNYAEWHVCSETLE